jgi:glycosyltransferase involved in cell wall biosynthesis
VHLSAWPFFEALAAQIALLGTPPRIGVDWHEVWSREYWQEYLGPLGGAVGYGLQVLCVRVPHHAFCPSRLYADRLRQEGLRGEAIVLGGRYAGSSETPTPRAADPLVVFAGRLIPEKRAPLAVAAFSEAAARIEGLHGEFYGHGPEREALLRAIEQHGVSTSLSRQGSSRTPRSTRRCAVRCARS